jgi:DnaJ-class molecular chaperone
MLFLRAHSQVRPDLNVKLVDFTEQPNTILWVCLKLRGLSHMNGTNGTMEEVTCAFCNGRGIDPFGIMSWISTCCVCGGRGVVQVQAPYRRGAHCRGTGAVKTLTCTVCHGTGYLSLVSGPVTECPECRGTGDDASSSLACIVCRGRGWLPLEDRK